MVRSRSPRLSTGPRPSNRRLTKGQQRVIALIGEGLARKEVADRLGIALKTVETHLYLAMKKLDLHSRAEVIRWGIEHGLVKVEPVPQERRRISNGDGTSKT